MRKALRTQQSGFTLIEVMVALVIFVALSFGVYQVLNQVQRSEAMTRESTTRLNQIQKTILIMDNDFRQIATRPFRTNGEAASSYLILNEDYLLDSDDKGMLFTRLGWSNPNQQFPRGEVVKVGYRIKDDQFQRVWWRYPDTVVGDTGTINPLLDGVEKWSAKYLDDGKWTTSWETENQLPEAISITLTLSDYGDITRIYQVPAMPDSSDGDSDE